MVNYIHGVGMTLVKLVMKIFQENLHKLLGLIVLVDLVYFLWAVITLLLLMLIIICIVWEKIRADSWGWAIIIMYLNLKG
jgi:hypothetical protein